MKTITFGTGQNNFGTVLLFFICFLFSLNSHSQKVLTWLSESWRNETWENSSQVLYVYDENGYLIHDKYQSFNVTWKDQFQNDYINNPDGTAQQGITQIWNAPSNNWEVSGRTTYTYNLAKKVLTSEYEAWINPNWIFYRKDTYTYDGNNYLTKILSQEYDFISSWDESQTTYSNNPDGTVSQAIVETGKANLLTNSARYTYTYTNSKLIMQLAEKWNGTTWENSWKQTMGYDGNGYLINVLNQDWIAGSWKNKFRSFYTNYGNGTPFQIVTEVWNDIGLLWKTDYRVTYTYFTLGVDEHAFEKSLAVYPNPAQDKITIKTDGNNIGVKYWVTDQLGRQFLNGTITDKTTEIDVSQLASGVYFVQMGQNKNQTIKIVKK